MLTGRDIADFTLPKQFQCDCCSQSIRYREVVVLIQQRIENDEIVTYARLERYQEQNQKRANARERIKEVSKLKQLADAGDKTLIEQKLKLVYALQIV
mmetsp:Transcript_16505/g.35675  ORF Transcript_16505/g.35675 Transcript_16505/m.35675 type:complete len:98 (+) Transcript_16505:624-917(+)